MTDTDRWDGDGMKESFARAREAVEKLFWDSCTVENFTEESTNWGETLHEKGEGETFPCRLTEKAAACRENGLLTETEKTVVLLYPAGEDIPAGSSVTVRLESGEERQYFAAGESRVFQTHKAVGLRRRDVV